MAILGKYKLKRDLPNLEKGVIFEHRDYDKAHPDRGNIGCGVMILGWLNGSCQDGWCGETYILPGQLATNKEWFEPLELNEKEQILNEIECLKERVLRL
jgi:hypothetical protein